MSEQDPLPDAVADGNYTRGKNQKPPKNTSTSNADRKQSTSDTQNIFLLEDTFPATSDLFQPSVVPKLLHSDCLVVIDTNALLLPYKLDSGQLASLREKYQSLRDQRRLFIPARVAREFINNRDGRLTDLMQALQNDSSQTKGASKQLPPHLSSVPGHAEFVTASENLINARKIYLDAVSKLLSEVSSWSGNDPVTIVYRALFDESNTIDLSGEREDIEREWSVRLRDKRPPGYKDAAKDDTGVGDFIIWKTILQLGAAHNKDVVFVTGEEKPDWMVRSNNRGIFPRPELVSEFKQFSSGRSIRISSLAQMLEELDAAPDIVEDVKNVEDDVNYRIRNRVRRIRSFSAPEFIFEYSQNDGIYSITDGNGTFIFQFSKAGRNSVHMYRTGEMQGVARAKYLRIGQVIDFGQFDSTSFHYTIHVGEYFLIKSQNNAVLLGKLVQVLNEDYEDSSDAVVIRYMTYKSGSEVQVIF